MATNINIAVISGEIAYVKIKYTQTRKVYASFAIKQPLITMEKGVPVCKDYNYFFCSCFDEAIYSSGLLKEGATATIQGRLSPYKTEEGKTTISLSVEKIDIHGFGENKK